MNYKVFIIGAAIGFVVGIVLTMIWAAKTDPDIYHD